ncbi:Uncharacterised protein [uncultured archaeon]|nr:Uncharacterised protein [uncultured archaeon]
MIAGKATLLARLYDRTKQFRSAEVGEHLEGASPTIFVGRFGYPKVFIGPMVPELHGDTRFMDTPEDWIPNVSTPEDIANFRLQLVRGKQAVNIRDTSKTTEMIRDIALSNHSTETEAQFVHRPIGGTFHEETQPFGPSATLKSLRIQPGKYDHQLEKAFYDRDLKAADAVQELYNKGSAISDIQRAFSVGAFGIEKNRKLVPTRWSITAVDSTLSEQMLNQIRDFPTIDGFRVYEYESLRNKFIVLLLPTTWCYESMEAFFPSIIGERLEIFGDCEGYEKKKEYALIGGCYYSARLAIGERLMAEQRQAGAVVLREAYAGYIPLGVWNVRENMRGAMKSQPVHFNDLQSALDYSATRLKVGMKQWISSTVMLRRIVQNGLPQTHRTIPLRLPMFFGSN